jgi:hypothetical protein
VTVTKPTLPPFNAAATCPKCGGTSVKACWQEADDYRSTYSYASKHDLIGVEFIERRCDRCYFVWAEAPLDGLPQ